MSDEEHKHIQFLRRMSTEGTPPSISQQTAQLALQVFLAMRNLTGGELPVPSASAGPDGMVFYNWDRGRHHLDVEIRPSHSVDYFYRDRVTGQTWIEEYATADPPRRVKDCLRLFVGTPDGATA